jgi:hypothetical protein
VILFLFLYPISVRSILFLFSTFAGFSGFLHKNSRELDLNSIVTSLHSHPAATSHTCQAVVLLLTSVNRWTLLLPAQALFYHCFCYSFT